MKVFIPALALAILITASAFAPSAYAARRSVPQYDQERARRDSGGSWQCYPYCQGGTYQGRPVREWLRPGGWQVVGGSRQSTLRASARGTVHFDEQLLLSPL